MGKDMNDTKQKGVLDSYTPAEQRRGLDRILADIERLRTQVRQGEPLGDLDRERDRLDAGENQQQDPERFDGLA